MAEELSTFSANFEVHTLTLSHSHIGSRIAEYFAHNIFRIYLTVCFVNGK